MLSLPLVLCGDSLLFYQCVTPIEIGTYSLNWISSRRLFARLSSAGYSGRKLRILKSFPQASQTIYPMMLMPDYPDTKACLKNRAGKEIW